MRERELESSGDVSISSVNVSEMIAKRAHEIFENRGGEHGHDLDDWLQAEQEIRASRIETAGVALARDQELEADAPAPTSLSTSEVRESKRSAGSGKRS